MRLSLPSLSASGLLYAVAAAACAGAVGVWGVMLLAPRPEALPPPLSAAPPRAPDNQAVARWFGKDEALQTDIKVLGVIAAGPSGAVVLSLDGGPATAYRVGQELPGALVLQEVAADTVVLAQHGRTLRLRAPAQAAAPAGIVAVR
ncbi:type II secretion system protein N [Bordetella genomosp. 12]|uniref:General secretion pathway protein GspC n=1 Tax=Bordetella genomosp. 12 TaxID=463035 RepID=A0A261VCL3_9BORD|nr:type II secretion system protein N [Bordetella genomosp. 12]OZI71886.1 general secretion pathway protein GspC [Bordetella genomosp. 12]